MKPQSQRAANPATRTKPSSPFAPRVRAWNCTYAAAALAAAALASSVLITADSTSVYLGSSLPQVLMLLAAGALASFGAIPPLPRWPAARLPLVLLALVLAWLLLGAISATWQANGRAAWNGFWHVAGLIVFGCLLSKLCRAPKVATAAAQLLILGAVMLSVHAVHQLAISLPQTRAEYERDPDRTLAELGLDAPPGSALRMQYESRLYSTEPLATFALTNSLAVVLAGALLFQGVLVIDALRRRARNYVTLLVGALVWLLMMSVGLLTKSRTAFLSILVVTAVSTAILWWLRRQSHSGDVTRSVVRSWIGAVAVAAIGMFAALIALLSRDTLILSEAPKSVAFRLEYWQATSKMILDHPLTGVGLGNFQSYYPQYKLATASETIADPHNWLFDIAACCSLPVLAVTLIALTMILVRGLSLLSSLLKEGATSHQEHATAVQSQHGASPASDGDAIDSDSRQSGVASALWIGAGAGWLLTAALQWVLQESIDLEAAALGLIVGGIAVFLLCRGSQPPEVVLRAGGQAAAATMLVCLLASGSWQASGISLPLIAWLAVGGFGAQKATTSNRTEALACETSHGGTDRLAWWQPALMVLLLAGFLFQTWRPVNSSWTHEQQALAAMQRGELPSALEYAHSSRAADPIDPAPYRLAVQILVYQAERESPEDFDAQCDRVETAISDLLECDPVANLHWAFAAESMMTLAAVAQERSLARQPGASPVALAASSRRLLERAAVYQEGAARRYPSSVALHAQLAVILALLDRTVEAGSELERAYALSDATPHRDRKLKKQQVWLPDALAPFPPSAVQRPAAGSDWVLAEPLCQFLRSKQRGEP